MPSLESSEIITRLQTVITVDNGRTATSPFKLPTSLHNDAVADLAALIATETDTDPAEGARVGASAAKRAALTELERQLRGGHRGIAALDEETITEGQRLQVFTSYGWESGELGLFPDARVLAMARLAPTVSAAEAGGNAGWLYTARELAGGTLLRVRFFYCSATRDVDATPELVRIGYQPRRAPGTGGDGGEPLPSGSSRSSSSSGGPGRSGSSGSSSSSS